MTGERADPLGRTLTLLGDPVRRQLLNRLRERPGPLPLADVREALDGDCEQTRLVHVHLPKLADANYLEWDRAADEVQPGDRFGEAEAVLDALDEHGEALPGTWP